MEADSHPTPVTRRKTLACAAALLPWLARPLPARAAAEASVVAAGADPTGRRDSSAAFNAAIAQSDNVHVPAGRYLISGVLLREGLTLRGDGENSLLLQGPDNKAMLLFESSSTTRTPTGPSMTLTRLQLRGACDTLGFSEYVQLIRLMGAHDVLLEDVVFRGFQGDGLYLGARAIHGGDERHNARITVRRCLFDGINRMNRNGISVIDCDGLTVVDSDFRNISMIKMPGAIDIEPNKENISVVRNIHIANNRFSSINGGGGAVSMYIPVLLDSMPSNILIENNVASDIRAGAFNLVQIVPPPPGAPSQNIVIRGNHASGKSEKSFSLHGLDGVELRDNVFEGAAGAAEIGFHEPTSQVRALSMDGNTFIRSGNVSGAAVAVYRVDGLQVTNNEFRDCGNGSAQSTVFDFAAGASAHVTIAKNRFLSPTGQTRSIARKEDGHAGDPATTIFRSDNTVQPGIAASFEALAR